MIKIDSIKHYLGALSPYNYRSFTNQLYDNTAHLKEDYPCYREWFYDVQLAGLCTDERDILLAHASNDPYNIIGMACLKNTPAERKLCTLVIDNGYRGLGIGGNMVDAAIAKLGTNKPFFTVPDYKLGMFQALINQHAWQLEQRVHGYYNDRHSELCFNGKLLPDAQQLPTPTPRKKTTCVIKPAAEIIQTTDGMLTTK